MRKGARGTTAEPLNQDGMALAAEIDDLKARIRACEQEIEQLRQAINGTNTNGPETQRIAARIDNLERLQTIRMALLRAIDPCAKTYATK